MSQIPGQPQFGSPSPFSGPIPGSPGFSSNDIPAPGKGKKGKKSDEPKPEKAPTNRTSRMFRIMAFSAVAVGVGAMFFVTQPEPSQYVVRAKVSVGALNQVTQSQLEAVKIDDTAVEPNAITGKDEVAALAAALKAIEGRSTQYPIFQGAQIHPEMFTTSTIKLEGSGGALAKDERLFSISAAVSGAVAGTLLPGDSVDIIAVTEAGDALANVVAYNVPIVQVNASEQQINSAASSQTGEGKNQAPGDLLPGDPIPGLYTLRVKDTQLPTLAAAAQGSTLYLAYRAPDAANSPSTPISAACVVASGVNPDTNLPASSNCAR